MFKWADTLTNTRGDSLVGWQVECVQESDGETVVPIYGDLNSTPIVSTSGVANRAVTDERGNYFFIVDSGTYSLRIYNDAGEFQGLRTSFTMYGNAELQVQNDLAEIKELRDEVKADATAASNPDANTQAALTASQNAQDAAAELKGVWGPKAVSVPSAIDAATDKIVMWNTAGRDLYVSLYQATTAAIIYDISDPELDDQVGFFQVSTPDYTSSGANLPDRVLFTFNDRLAGLPADDPDGANYTGLGGYLELKKDGVVEGTNPIQPTSVTQTQLNPLNVHTPYTLPAKPRDTRLWDYKDIIQVGPGRSFTTSRAAVESLYRDGPLAAPLGVAVQPVSLRADPFNPVLIVLDPGTYQDVNLHLPDWVSMMARFPGTVTFETSPGATRPGLQAHLNHQLIGINWRNTVLSSPNSATSSAVYAVHRDFFHGQQNADAEGNYPQSAALEIIGGSLTVAGTAAIQALGCAVTTHDRIECMDVDFDCDNDYDGILAACNNSSDLIGGGRFVFRNCRDISGRSSNATVGVQVKQAQTYHNELILQGNRNFNRISLSGFGTGGASGSGNWKLRGDWEGEVISTISGDNMGYV